MKIPWRQKNTKSIPSTSSTDRPSSSCNIIGAPKCTVLPVDNYDILTSDDATEMKMTNSSGTGTTNSTIITTPVKQKPTVHCHGDVTTSAASITSSPTLLGSGHYSPVDGSVQTFAPTTSVLIQPTALTFEQHSEDDYDVYLTPLQSSVASVDEGSNHLKEEYELSVNKSATLTVVESTLTDITTDATVDGEEVKEDSGDSGADSPTAVTGTTGSTVPPPPPTTTTTATTGVESFPPPSSSKSPKFIRHASSFLRVSDLIGMDPTMDLSEHSHKSIPNYHCCSDAPPPGIPHDILEKWVALDDGCCRGNDNTTTNNTTETTMSTYTPIAQFAVDALAATALATILDATMWIPDSKTAKIIESKSPTSWEANTFQLPAPTLSSSSQSNIGSSSTSSSMPLEDHILIWSGTFRHGLYGSEIPAIRSASIIYMSAAQLLHLLMDSNRVKEYNTMSLGRTDLLTLPCRHIVTKVMRSESRPPLLRKTLQFTSIFHARKLVVNDNDDTDDTNTDNDSYLLVTRAVENPTTTNSGGGGDTHGSSSSNSNNVVVSEILLGVNVIRTIPNRPNACLLLSVNHVRSPMVPSLFLAKRLGLQAATNFVHDLRKCCR